MQSPSPSGPFVPEIDTKASVLDQALLLVRAGLQLVLIHAPVFNGLPPGPSTTCTCERDDCTIETSAGKHPIARNWQKNPLVDDQQVRDAFASVGFTPNLGIVLGAQPSGDYLVSIDVDDEARFASLQVDYGELPDTAASLSARGKKLFFSIPATVDRERIKNITGIGGSPGVDMKAKGGQVVAPPSLHARGARYSWVRAGSIVELPPAWILAILKKKEIPSWAQGYTPELLKDSGRTRRRAEQYLNKAVVQDATMLSRIGQGLRNNTLFESLCRLLPLAQGLGLGETGRRSVINNLAAAAKTCGLSPKEILATVKSAEKKSEAGSVRVPDFMRVIEGGKVSAPQTAETPETPEILAGITAAAEALPGPIKLLTHKGQNAPIAENIARILEQHPVWLGGPKLDTFRMNIIWDKIPEPLKGLSRNEWKDTSDADALAIQGWLIAQASDGIRIAASKETCKDGFALAGTRNFFDSLKNYVNGFAEWDGVNRLDTWLTTYFGATPTPGTSRVGRVWLIASIARVDKPGCMVDIVPILETPMRQRVGKNRAVAALYGGTPYVQTPTITRVGENKELDRTASTSWCIHDDESKLFSSKQDSTKAWITRTYDVYRVPWDRMQTTAPRRAVLVCSTNKSLYFQDDENARFFPIRCGTIDVPGIERDREQLWAEAIIAYQKGELWYIPQSDPIWRELRTSQRERKEEDGLMGPVDDWLAKLPPGTTPRSQSILDALAIKPEDRTVTLSHRLHKVMHELGWEYVNVRVTPEAAAKAGLTGEEVLLKFTRVWRVAGNKPYVAL
jgi:predicted P-loop ATPase